MGFVLYRRASLIALLAALPFVSGVYNSRAPYFRYFTVDVAFDPRLSDVDKRTFLAQLDDTTGVQRSLYRYTVRDTFTVQDPIPRYRPTAFSAIEQYSNSEAHVIAVLPVLLESFKEEMSSGCSNKNPTIEKSRVEHFASYSLDNNLALISFSSEREGFLRIIIDHELTHAPNKQKKLFGHTLARGAQNESVNTREEFTYNHPAPALLALLDSNVLSDAIDGSSYRQMMPNHPGFAGSCTGGRTDDAAYSLLETGNTLYQQGLFDEADEAFEKAEMKAVGPSIEREAKLSRIGIAQARRWIADGYVVPYLPRSTGLTGQTR